MSEQYEPYRLVWHRVGESGRAAVLLGKVNVELTPNPFAEGCEYTQELDVFVDKREDVLVVSGRSDVPVTAKVSYQNWRMQRPAPEREAVGTRFVLRAALSL